MKEIIAAFSFLTGAIIMIAILAMLFAWPFMWAWNFAVIKAITITAPIDYWTAYVLMLFIGVFFASRSNNTTTS